MRAMTSEYTGQPESVDLLVDADYLFPLSEPGDGSAIRDAQIAVRDGLILHAGSACPEGTWAPRERIRARGQAAMPGFVNTHCHTASPVFRSQTDDALAGSGLYAISFRGEQRIAPEDWQMLARLGTAEMILAGYTTLNDFWYCPDAMGELALETGLRMQIACEIYDVDKPAVAHGVYNRDTRRGERMLAEAVRVAETWNGRGDGRIGARIGPHAADTCAASLHLDCVAEARRLGIGLHCHVAQSPKEDAMMRAAHGTGSVRFLADIGALGPDWVLAHLVQADAEDRRAAAEAGASCAHCPTIYPRRGYRAPLLELREAGITLGLGSDWMLNDPFEGMRTMVNLTRVLAADPDALSTSEALEMATAGAARALGLEAQTGRLVPGKAADFILVDVDAPNMQPFYGEPASLVYYARPSDVRSSFVQGRTVMRDRVIPGFDLEAAKATVRARVPHLGAQMRDLGGRASVAGCPCGMH